MENDFNLHVFTDEFGELVFEISTLDKDGELKLRELKSILRCKIVPDRLKTLESCEIVLFDEEARGSTKVSFALL